MWCGAPASGRCSTGSTCRSIGADGWPLEMRGVVPGAPGLFFCGLAFQYALSSTVLPGVGRDAAYVAKQIGTRVSRSLALAA